MVANILGVARTPISTILGSLSGVSSIRLGSISLSRAVVNSLIPSTAIDHLVLSQAFPIGCGPSPAKQIAANSGLSHNASTVQISQSCTSGLKALSIAFSLINSRKSHVTAVVGTESTSKTPFILSKARSGGYNFGNDLLIDPLTNDTLNLPEKAFDATRSEEDEYILESFRRLSSCYSDGIIQNEIVPIVINKEQKSKREGSVYISHPHVKILEDTYYKTFNPQKLKRIAPVSDGGASIILASQEFTELNNLVPIARILDYTEASLEFPEGASATIKELKKIAKFIDIYDILDQSPLIPIHLSKALELDFSRINLNGNCLSLGHPIGMSGVRQVVSLITVLKSHRLQYGCATATNSHGEAISILLENWTR